MVARSILQPTPSLDTDEKSLVPSTANLYSTVKRTKMSKARPNIVHEILDSERKYVDFLKCVKELYIDQLSKDSSIVSQDDLKRIFCNWESLYTMHADGILRDLLAVEHGDIMVGRIFLRHTAYIKMYSAYVNNYDTACAELAKLLKRKRFA